MKATDTHLSKIESPALKGRSLKEDIDRRYAVITKNLGLAFSFAFLFFSVNDYLRMVNRGMAYTLDEFRINLVVIIGLLIYLLAKKGKAYPAKWLLLVLIPILLFVLPGLAGISKYDYIFWFPYGVIVFSILPLLICKWKEEAFLMIFSMVLLFLILLFIEKLLFAGFSPDDLIVEKYRSILYMIKSEQMVVYLLLNALILYSRMLQGKLERSLELNNRHISEQKEELMQQNEKLVQAQKELAGLNEQILADREELKRQNEELRYYQSKVKRINEELEVRVKKRTRELEDRNARLKEYAFINAHLLRAPLCRIKGLTYLVEKDREGDEGKLLELLKASNDELEEIIRKITSILSEEKELNRDMLYELYSRDEIKRSKGEQKEDEHDLP